MCIKLIDLAVLCAELGGSVATVGIRQLMSTLTLIGMGAQTDPELLKYGADAHASAISSLPASGARAEADLTATKVAQANPVTPSAPASSLTGNAARSIAVAADELSTAACPFTKDAPWTSNLSSKPTPGTVPQKVTRAIGRAITAGAAMDRPSSLKGAANAHAQAFGGRSTNVELSQSGFAPINAGLWKAIARVPTCETTRV